MRKMLIGLLALVSLSSYSADNHLHQKRDGVLLSEPSQSIPSKVILLRDRKSPDKINLQVSVPLRYSVCTQNSVRTIFGKDESCGYETIWERRCGNTCVDYRDCSNGNPRTRSDDCGCRREEYSCYNSPVNVMRSCNYQENYCANYGIQERTQSTNVTLDLKRADTLEGEEKESFELNLDQSQINSNALTLSFVEVTGKYKIKIKDLFGFKVIIKK